MKVSIKKFQELYSIAQSDTDELTKSSLLIQNLTGKTEAELDKMNIVKYGRLCKRLNDLFERYVKDLYAKKPKQYVKANGQWYFLNYDLEKQNAGKYVEVATFGSDLIGNLHKIIATMATPMVWTWKGLKLYEGETNHNKIANDMLELDFEVAYHAAVFFCAVLRTSMLNLNIYFTQMENPKAVELGENLAKILDGYTMPKWYQNLKISA